MDDNPAGDPPGVYNVDLSLSDGGSQASTAQASVTVDDAQPVLSGVAIASEVNVGELSVLHGMVQNIGPDDGFTLDVNWGNGSDDQIQSYPAGTQRFTLTYAYVLGGTYTVTATVTDNAGDTCTATASAEVDDPGPHSDAIGPPGGGSDVVSISPSLADGNGSSQSLEFTISSSGTATGQLSVYFTPGGTAPGTAYDLVDASGNPLSSPLDVPAGGSTNVYVKPLGPLPPWSDETVTLTLDPGHSGYTVDPDAQDAAAILDAPALPEVSFDSSTIQQEVTEDGDPNGIDVTFNVDVSKAFAQATDVVFAAYGTATEGEQPDVTLPAGDTVPFAAGQTQANLVVHVNNNDVAEGDENLGLVLESDASGPLYLADPAPARLAIQEAPGTFTINSPTDSEFDGQMTFRATGSQLSGPVLLFWKTQDGPAASDGPANSNPLLGVQDYVAASGWIVLSPSQPTATIPITLLGNNNSDSSKCMSVNLYRCAAGGATVPAGASPVATGAGTIVNSSAMLHVAAINDNVPTGYLPMSKQTTTGAFIPVDNGDADYDGIPDDEDPASQPVPGDDRLLPIYIQPGATLPAGGYYTLTVPSFLSVWQSFNRSGLVLNGQVLSTVQLPATQSTITLYLEATSDLFIPGLYGSESITVVWHDSSNSHTLTSFAHITPFGLDGPLDVPGNCTYQYTCSTFVPGMLPNGTWLAPYGGTLASAATATSASITWANGLIGFVGSARYQATADYVWDMDVNVVSIEITGTLTTFGQPEQDGAWISSDLTGSAMSSTLRVWAQGPVVNGQPRGLSYIQMGFVQIAQVPEYRLLFHNPIPGGVQPSSVNNIQGKTQFDALAAPPGWPVPASLLPWDDSWNRTWPNATWTPTPHGAGFDTPLVDQQFQIDDTPGQSVWGLPGQPPAVWGNIPVTLAGVQIVYKFTTCFAVRTEALGATNPDSRYFGLATDGWTCDMSGTFPNGTYSTTGANWTGAAPSPNPSTSNYTVLAAPYLLPQDLFNVPVVNSYLTSTSWDWDPLPTQ